MDAIVQELREMALGEGILRESARKLMLEAADRIEMYARELAELEEINLEAEARNAELELELAEPKRGLTGDDL